MTLTKWTLARVPTTSRLRDKPKMSNDARNTGVLWMIDAIKHDNILEIEGTQPGEASNIDAILTGNRSPLMVGVDATVRAKEMPSRTRVELVDR